MNNSSWLLAGGLKAVIYTDTLQTVIMVGGAIVLMALSMNTSLLNPLSANHNCSRRQILRHIS